MIIIIITFIFIHFCETFADAPQPNRPTLDIPTPPENGRLSLLSG